MFSSRTSASFRPRSGRNSAVPSRSRRGWRPLLAGLALLLFATGTGPTAATAREVRLSRGRVDLSEFDPGGTWKGLNLRDRRVLIPHLVDHGVLHYDRDTKKKVLLLLKEARDPFARAYFVVASAYFRTRKPDERLAYLGRYRSQRSERRYRGVLEYHIGLLNYRLGRGPAERMLGICDFAEQDDSCRLARLLNEVDGLGRSGFDLDRIRKILNIARPFLERVPLVPPFFRLAAEGLPDRLYAAGLPLEAAILADRMTFRDSSPSAETIRRRIPFYLSGAADFSSAYRYSEKVNPGNVSVLNARLDWLMLAGRYSDAIKFIARYTPERLSAGAMQGQTDYWTWFPYSPEGLRLRVAMMLYLGGEVQNAARALEKLTQFRGHTSGGEPESYFARLRLAQILMRKNPKLAQKIAEDISYIAQEKEWFVLEYHATVLDGWALYHLGQDYKALVQFRKSRGILKGENEAYATEYSRLLGTLAVRSRMGPRGNYHGLIKSINGLLQKRPYNEAIYTIREWVPVGLGPHHFVELALKSQEARRNPWGMLNLLVEFDRVREYFYSPGNNPGGARGFDMSIIWSRELEKFNTISALGPVDLRVNSAALSFARQRSPRIEARELSAGMLAGSPYYLMSFDLGARRWIALVHPRSGAGVSFVQVSRKDARIMARDCRRDNPGGCAKFQEAFQPFRALLARTPGAQIKVRYEVDFDLNYETLLGGGSDSPVAVYFQSIARTGEAPGRGSLPLYSPGNCPVPAGFRGGRSADFVELFSTPGSRPAGAWLWPSRLDVRNTGSGRMRPVYLRNFICGNERVRLWDMDRFSSREGPAVLIYEGRQNEPELDNAFVRHFAEKGTILVETGRNWNSRHADRLLRQLAAGGGHTDAVVRAFMDNRAARPGDHPMRVILPSILD